MTRVRGKRWGKDGNLILGGGIFLGKNKLSVQAPGYAGAVVYGTEHEFGS